MSQCPVIGGISRKADIQSIVKLLEDDLSIQMKVSLKIIVKSEDKKYIIYKKKSYGTIKGFSSCSRHLLNKNCFTLDLNFGWFSSNRFNITRKIIPCYSSCIIERRQSKRFNRGDTQRERGVQERVL